MKKSRRIKKLIKAAKMGHPYSMYKLGLVYDVGEELPENPELALALIDAAAEMGCAGAIAWMEDYHFDDDARVQAEA